MNSTQQPKKQKRPRTLDRYEQLQHASAKASGWALVHVEVNDAYISDAHGCNISTHGPASPAFARALRDLIYKNMRGEFEENASE